MRCVPPEHVVCSALLPHLSSTLFAPSSAIRPRADAIFRPLRTSLSHFRLRKLSGGATAAYRLAAEERARGGGGCTFYFLKAEYLRDDDAPPEGGGARAVEPLPSPMPRLQVLQATRPEVRLET